MDQTDWIDLVRAVCDDAGVAPGPIEPVTTWDQKFYGSDEFRNSAVFRIWDQCCLNTHLYSFSMGELFPEFTEKAGETESIVREMTEFFFPPDVFGPPD
ncbi:MAG: hypothetical protein QY328_17990 [Anaerolineales bacterium]|jgi:hypothetical protein|nr:MAG: hypothetical protein QY328_17990 [Anaerolineales bacterium]